MWQVHEFITNMSDFVTSYDAVVLFETEQQCKDYVASSQKFHPGRFTYSIKPYEPAPPRKPRRAHPDDDWWWNMRNKRVQCHGKGDAPADVS